ncbi:hypothetical protein GCM10010869_20880 [Mesorhizobium tianshanense]|uniref:hypothetical protein n=1 Tax=Mesorhizobium tianshanense TaxID=39844 RepID=UPI0011A5DC32|nr:hypothetical protein [Mesorhizobium tianshanense]GLS36499.1 hypothetical protein GCM10010869_20880 [Mesorhizobium tianshanense]
MTQIKTRSLKAITRAGTTTDKYWERAIKSPRVGWFGAVIDLPQRDRARLRYDIINWRPGACSLELSLWDEGR